MKHLNIHYYKETGKYYTTHVVDEPILTTLEEVSSHLHQAAEKHILPGLITGKWKGYILIELCTWENGIEMDSVTKIMDLMGYRD